MLVIILLQVDCVRDSNTTELFHKTQFKIKIIQRLSLPCQVLALGGAFIPVLGGNITMPSIIYGMKILAQNVTGITVPNSGHFIPEEQPQFLADQLLKFFGNAK